MYIGIYPEKISFITQQTDQSLSSSISEMQINPLTLQNSLHLNKISSI
ncbi:hypothetical protein PRO82_002012 [Candidatus Protochlamydia amoebophila]|nr:hypothetical protein [Candidatus Protochlamydia amoebophila]